MGHEGAPDLGERSTVMELDTLYRRAVESWTDQVRAVAPDQWKGPTPCTDWNVRALVNHVVGEDLWTGPLCAAARSRRWATVRRRPAG